MYLECIRNMSGNHLFFQNSLVANFQEQSFAWTIFFLLIVSYADEARSLTDDLIQLNSTEFFETDAPQDRRLTEVTQEHWQEMLSLAKKRLDKKEKDWSTYALESAVFPALTVLAVAGWYFGDYIPGLQQLHPQFRAYLMVDGATAIATIYPWMLRDAKRWLYGEEKERTEWLLAYTIFWAIQAGIWSLPGTIYGRSFAWSQLAGYTLLDLLYQSGDIAADDDTLLFIMSVVSAVVADAFYFVAYPTNPLPILTHEAHALGLVNGAVIYYLMNRVGREEKPLDEPCR